MMYESVVKQYYFPAHISNLALLLQPWLFAIRNTQGMR